MKETLTKSKKKQGLQAAQVGNKCQGLDLCMPFPMAVGGNSESEHGVVKKVEGMVGVCVWPKSGSKPQGLKFVFAIRMGVVCHGGR